MTKPRFKPDELVVAVDSFTATIDGAPFVANPTDVLRGDNPIVLAYPHMFRQEGDQKALTDYKASVVAEQQAERRRQQAEEAKRAAKLRQQVQALADKLEPEERRRREQLAEGERADFREKEETRRRRLEGDAKQAEQQQIRALAAAEVARRLESGAA